MKQFEGASANGSFFVGCTGSTVYVYGENNRELKRFKDLTCAYHAIISPDGKIFVVKSTDGWLAVYSLESLTLQKKFCCSEVVGGQDYGYCFSADGNRFFNVERHGDVCQTFVSVYDTSDFALLHRIGESNIMIEHIEYDSSSQTCYVLGYERDADGIFHHPIVAKVEGDQLAQIVPISQSDYRFYSSYMEAKLMGLTESMGDGQLVLMGHSPKSYEGKWMREQLELIRSGKHSLGKLHIQYYS